MSEQDEPDLVKSKSRPARPKKRGTSGPVPFGPYRLLNLLGQGGMGRVYRAVRYGAEGGEEELALKILDRRATSTSAQVRALVDEVRLGQLLRHQNIVRTDELRKVGDSYCIAMEYVDGWPLDRLVELHRKQGQPIPLVTALELMMAIADGLTYAHNLEDENGQHLGLVHRDLKPGNVMIGRDGSVKLMDFGTAKSAANLYQTEDGETRGTPLYMSPEQVMGSDLDQRSDIFSLGSILYELVMLEPCFRGSNLVMVMRNVADADLDEQREDIASAASALEPIFSRCMQSKPELRFQSAPELYDELRTLHQSRPVGPSVRGWLDTLSGHTPDSTTGDFGSVAIPGTTNELPVENIQDLDTRELQTARLAEAAREDENLSKTLDPESVQTGFQVVQAQNTPVISTAQSPVAPETADILSTNEFHPLDENQQVLAENEPEPPRTSPQESEITEKQEREARPKPPARKRRPARQKLPMKRKSSARFWLRYFLPLGISIALLLGMMTMLPSQMLDDIKSRAAALLSSVLPESLQDSSSGQSGAFSKQSHFVADVVHIDAAELILGSPEDPATRPSRNPIAVPPFDMMIYEVTVGDFETWCRSKEGKKLCTGWKGPESWQDKRHPVVSVSWNEASAFCQQWGGTTSH